MELYRQFDPPYGEFDRTLLGPNFAGELTAVSKLWFSCGYRQGIAAYLNFFLLRDFIVTHDTAYPPRFRSFQSMAASFYQTDLFIRDVTDSGRKPTGGISSGKVRQTLKQIMARHQRIAIPGWMMTYFGFSLMEMVEKQCGVVTPEEKRLHLAYMAKVYRIMGLAFSDRREAMEQFSRQIEEAHAGPSPHLEAHAAHILLLGEMVGVSSKYEDISAMLPEKTKALFQNIYPRVRPGAVQRFAARISGRFLVPQAVGKPRQAVPVAE